MTFILLHVLQNNKNCQKKFTEIFKYEEVLYRAESNIIIFKYYNIIFSPTIWGFAIIFYGFVGGSPEQRKEIQDDGSTITFISWNVTPLVNFKENRFERTLKVLLQVSLPEFYCFPVKFEGCSICIPSRIGPRR